ncbi:hypothetical protein [Neptuniibacter sp. QD37_11]|uniref:hypothetical protein n=1 Tax=Neptuniibacter sp. QD37_11 TaxID=3398209 RepID=UPI0039F4CB73
MNKQVPSWLLVPLSCVAAIPLISAIVFRLAYRAFDKESAALDDKVEQMQDEVLWRLRDQLHNLPFHLNLPKQEARFLHDVYCQLPSVRDTREFAYFSAYQSNTEARKYFQERYLGKSNFSGPQLTEADLDAIFGSRPRPEKAYFLAGLILLHNFDCYQRQDEWWKSVNHGVRASKDSLRARAGFCRELAKELDEGSINSARGVETYLSTAASKAESVLEMDTSLWVVREDLTIDIEATLESARNKTEAGKSA